MSKFTPQRKTGGGISVEEYGAGGDGVIDDTRALQWALNEEPCVHIPTGTYLVDGSLTAPLDNQSIKGAGKGTVLKLKGSKIYDLSNEHATLTLNASDQTVENLRLRGPNTDDDSTFTGSGSDWYNLSALHINGERATLSGVHVDRCEGVGMTLSGKRCEVSLCSIQRTGLDALRATAKEQFVLGTRFFDCGREPISNITTYPPDAIFAVHFRRKYCVASECYFANNTRDIMCREHSHVICNNICHSGVDMAACGGVVNNNVIRCKNGNAITVANDGLSFIASLTGNDVYPMDEGGVNDIIEPSSYIEHPVHKATANRDPDIDRIYQQKAYAHILPDNADNNSDGSVPLRSLDHAQLIDLDVVNDTLAVDRTMLVQITMPPIPVNTEFVGGWFHVTNEDTGSRVSSVITRVCHNSTSGNYFLEPSTSQVRLQPNTTYKLYMFTDRSQTVADLTYDEYLLISITDLE